MTITTTIKAGDLPKTIQLPEGQSLTLSGSAGASGVAYLLDQVLGGTNSLKSWAIGSGTLPAIGGYAGSQQILISCTVGTIIATVGDAVLSAAMISGDGGSIAAAGGRFNPIPGLVAINGFDCPCDDAASVFRDRSGNMKHIVPMAANTAAFSSTGYMTSVAGTDKYNFLPASKVKFDLFSDSFWLHIGKINKAAPATNEPLAGIGGSTGSGINGFYLSARTIGTLVPVFTANNGTYTDLTSYTASQLGMVLDGTDHAYDLLYDKNTRGIYVFVDGKVKAIVHNSVRVTAPSPTTMGMAFGANYQPLAATGFASVDGKFSGVAFVKFEGAGLPLNIRQMVASMAKFPQQPIKSLPIIPAPASAYWLIGWCGQSNEAGTSDVPQENVNYGLPTKDVLLVTGNTWTGTPTAGSMFPSMVEACAAGGKHLVNLNTSLGGTSLSQYWCGMFVAWAASTYYNLGAYAVAAGNVYKLTASSNATPTGGTSGATQPVWPGSGVIVDGELTWTYIRAATSSDVVGTVLTYTNVLFDPNGAFASMRTNMNLFTSPGMRKAMAISIGQTDKSVGDTQAIYQAALISATNFALSQVWEVFIGMTCDGATTGMSAWLYGIGQPARNAALAEFSGNPAVHPGVDLLATLGPLTAKSYDIGLRPDNLHMNSMTANDAGAAWGKLLAENV